MRSTRCNVRAPLIEQLEARTFMSAAVIAAQTVGSVRPLLTGPIIVAPPPTTTPPDTIPSATGLSSPILGGNLNGPTDRIADHPFTDLVKTTRGFFNLAGRVTSTGFVDYSHITSLGWPTEDFSFSAADNSEYGDSLTPGAYHISFVGPATTVVTIRENAANSAAVVPDGTPLPSIANVGYDADTQVNYYDVTVPQGALLLAFNFTNTAGKVRNIKVLQPGYDLSNYPTFSNEYLNLMRYLSPGVVRLMDWTHTNGNLVVNWSDRTQPNFATQARGSSVNGLQSLKGVAWEYGIQLANTLHADIWVNIPAHASDTYVKQLATLLRKTLSPDLAIYVEYSNEVWNTSFEQGPYNAKVADTEVVNAAKNGQTSNLNYDKLAVNTSKADGGANAVTWADRRIARRLKTISDLFKNNWTSAGLATPINTRVRPILCGQFANMSRFDNMLNFINSAYGPPSNFFYGIGIAPYLDLRQDAAANGLTTDQAIADLTTDANTYVTGSAFTTADTKATTWGLKLEAYEGGLDLYGANSIPAKQAASLDPRIQGIITTFVNAWYSHGGDLFNWYTLGARSFNTPYGAYAITDDITNYTEPKELAYIAIRDQLTAPAATEAKTKAHR